MVGIRMVTEAHRSTIINQPQNQDVDIARLVTEQQAVHLLTAIIRVRDVYLRTLATSLGHTAAVMHQIAVQLGLL